MSRGRDSHSMTQRTELLNALDRQFLWHPFTQQLGWQAEDAPIIERGKGTTLYDTEGNAYIDGVSSLWCNVHGHQHPKIDAAIREQLDRLAHSTLLGLTHPPAIELAKQLVEIAPQPAQTDSNRQPLTRVFYSDNGSTANEIALKMAYQWWAHRGEPKRSGYIRLRDAYHGDTVGAVSVGGIDLFHQVYKPLLFETWEVEPGNKAALQQAFQAHGDHAAAVIVEPLMQGAAGMMRHPDGFLKATRDLCDQYGIPLICDEVATGFGRTGTMFACEQEGVVPDFLTVAKGITGGYLPLAATLTTERIYEGFLGRFEELKTFFHGHTYTGNPLACAAALATLSVFREEKTLAQLQDKIGQLTQLLDELVLSQPAVAEIRQRGFMVGIQLKDFPSDQRTGHRVTLEARKQGAIIRPIGDVVILMPPLGITPQELQRLVKITAQAIQTVTV